MSSGSGAPCPVSSSCFRLNTWVERELWHGTWEGDSSDLTRIDPDTGEVLEILELPAGTGVSGLESDGGDQFFSGGGNSGKLRVLRRPRH